MNDNNAPAPPAPPQKSATSTGSCISRLNYCFWAKLLVAIPALPLVALLAARQFSNPLLQIVAAAVAIFVVIYAARKIDKLPIFSGMIIKRK